MPLNTRRRRAHACTRACTAGKRQTGSHAAKHTVLAGCFSHRGAKQTQLSSVFLSEPHTHTRARARRDVRTHKQYIIALCFLLSIIFPFISHPSSSHFLSLSLSNLSPEQYAGTDVKMYYFAWLAPMFCVLFVCVCVCVRACVRFS